jgi:chromosome segregation ATPase
VPFELASLPFDLYQRHRLAQEVVDRVRGRRKRLTILDVGGAPGHLKKFLPRDRIIVLDREAGGGEGIELVGDGRQLPFADRAVDVVVSLDTLEHLSGRQRPGLLRELARVSDDAVLISAPFGGPQTEEAESILQGFLRHRLKMEHRFLDEHAQHGLPEREAVERALSRHLGPVVALPNGCLDRWLMLMALSFYLDVDPSLTDLKRQVSAYFNRNYYRSDNAEPAYRYLLVARRPPAKPLITEGLLAETGRRRVRIDFSPINALIEVTGLDLLKEAYKSIETLQERLSDKDQNAVRLQADKEQRQRVIDGMQTEMQRRHERVQELQAVQAELQETLQERSRRLVDLSRALERRDDDLGRLVAEKEELEARLAGVGSTPEAEELNTRVSELAEELREIRATQNLLASQRELLTQQVKDRDTRIVEMEGQLQREQASMERLRDQMDRVVRHGGNLETILERKEKHLGALTEHAGNLQKLLERQRTPAEEAQAARELNEARARLGQLEELLQESRGEGERLARELAARTGKMAELERRTGSAQAEAALRTRQVAALEQQAADLQSALERHEAQRAQLGQSLEHWQRRAEELTLQADAVDESRKHALDQAETLRQVLQGRQRRIADLETHADQLKERGGRLFRQVKLLRDVAETRQQTVSEVNAQAERIRADATALRAELDITSQDRGRALDELALLRPQRAEALRRMQQEMHAAQEARQERDAAQRRADERDRTAREQAVLTQRVQDVAAEQRQELHARAERLGSLRDQVAALEARLGQEQSAGEELAAALDTTREQLQITQANLEARSRQAESLAEDLGRLRGRRLVRLLRKLGLA